MVRYTKYRKEYNKAEFTTKDSFVNKKLNRKEGEIVEDDEKIIVQVENPTSSKVLKNKRGFEMRNREKTERVKKGENNLSQMPPIWPQDVRLPSTIYLFQSRIR